MHSLFTSSLLLGTAVAVPINAGKDYPVPNEHSHYADKRHIIPPAVNQVNNFINEAIAEALTADVTAPAFTEAASTTALPSPVQMTSLLLGPEMKSDNLKPSLDFSVSNPGR
ncbi:hypothetical protein ACHAO7_008378 [Fusarium culmorum]